MTESPRSRHGGGTIPASRDLLLDATMDVVLAGGYERATVEAVIARVGVSRSDFIESFADLEDCCLQAYMRNNERFGARVFAAYETGRSWRESLRAAAYAAARFLTEHPREVRFNVIHSLQAGERLQAERDRYLQRLVDLIDAGRQELEDPDSLGRGTAEAAVGSIVALMARGVNARGSARGAQGLVPQLMYVAVRPYLGEAAAREELAIPPPRGGEGG